MKFWWPFRRRSVEVVKPSRYGTRSIFTGHDEQLAVDARKRRDIADQIRRSAARIETNDGTRAKLTRVR